MKKRSLSSNESTHKKLKKVNVIDKIDTNLSKKISSEPDKLYQSFKKGSRGIRSANSRYSSHESILLNECEFRNFNAADFNTLELNRFVAEINRSNYLNWLWILQLNSNILFHGYGDMTDLLDDFVETTLKNEDVLRIDGDCDAQPNRNSVVYALLDQIAIITKEKKILKSASIETYARYLIAALDKHYGREDKYSHINVHNSKLTKNSDEFVLEDTVSAPISPLHDFTKEIDDMDSNPKIRKDDWTKRRPKKTMNYIHSADEVSNPNPSWGKRYADSQARLYIAIHNIDGKALCSKVSQSILALLASSPSISMMASISRMNAQLLWSPLDLCLFGWVYVHAPTYQDYPNNLSSLAYQSKYSASTNRDFGSTEQKNTKSLNNFSFENILNSLTNRHKDVLKIMIKNADIIENSSTNLSSKYSIRMEHLMSICKRQLVVRKNPEFQELLNELMDQRLIYIETKESKKTIHMMMSSRQLHVLENNQK